MSVSSEEQADLMTERKNILRRVMDCLTGQQYLEAVMLLEDAIIITRKLGENLEEYYQKIVDCIDRFKSIQDDVDIIAVDDELRVEIQKERDNLIKLAQEAAQSTRTQEAVGIYRRALEFSLKLRDKKNIWKLSKNVSLLENNLRSTGQLASFSEINISSIQVEALPQQIDAQIEAPASSIQVEPPVIETQIHSIQSVSPAIEIPRPTIDPKLPSIKITDTSDTSSSSTVAAPIKSIEAAMATLGVEEEDNESDEDFLDAIVQDLKKQPTIDSGEVSDLPIDDMIASSVPSDSSESKMSAESTVEDSTFLISAPSTSSPMTSKKEKVSFFIPALEEKESIEEEEEEEEDADEDVKNIFETEDKKLLKKLKLAEKIAQKKLEEAEKKFKKELKKEEKQKGKEEKKIQEPSDREAKESGKLKSKYQGSLSDDILAEIRSTKKEKDS